jgi:hypothetical protein
MAFTDLWPDWVRYRDEFSKSVGYIKVKCPNIIVFLSGVVSLQTIFIKAAVLSSSLEN